MVDLFFANNSAIRDAGSSCAGMVSSGCASICSSSEIALRCARAKIQTQNPIHSAPRHCNSGGSLPITSLIFPLRGDKLKRVKGPHDDQSCTPTARSLFHFLENDVLLELIAVMPVRRISMFVLFK